MQRVHTSSESHALASNMRHMRKRLGLSQEDLAQRIGLNRGNIASYEKGTAEPKLCNLLKFSQLFGVSIHDLTKRDLSCDCTYKTAYTNFVRLNSEEAAALQDFSTQADEFKDVFQGINRCYEFLSRKNGEVNAHGKMLAGQYDQLQHLTDEILRAHAHLLDFVTCRLKE
jgi:transcriptional regulator with XRE-family HTH domain